MTDQPDGPRHDAKAAHDLPGEAEFAADCTDSAGGVDRQHLARFLFGHGLHLLDQRDVFAGLTVFRRDLEQAGCAWVDRLVYRMAQAGHDGILRAELLDRFQRDSVQIRARANFVLGKCFVEHL